MRNLHLILISLLFAVLSLPANAGLKAVAGGSSSGGGGGVSRVISVVTTDTTASAAASTDYVYIANCASACNITLPTAVSNTNLYTVKRVGAGVVTVLFTGGQNADGSTSLALNTAYTSLDFVSDNSNWIVR